MRGVDIELWVKYRATHAESIEQRHAEFMDGMSRIGPPLGFGGLVVPFAPDCGAGLAAAYAVKLPVRGVKFLGNYIYRGERFIYKDEGAYDDFIRYGFRTSNKEVDYRAILHEHLPKVTAAFRGYKAFVTYGYHGLYYLRGGDNGYDSNGYAIETNAVYNRLLADKSVNVDGRNNIYTLGPAMYWDAELCQRALGYGPDEVIRRLNGKVPKVQRLMDGVYTVFNDDPSLSYDEFVAMNEYFKFVLGLI